MSQVKILREKEVKELTGLSRSIRQKMVSEGRFPSPVFLSEKASGWLSDEIDSWIEERREHRSWRTPSTAGERAS